MAQAGLRTLLALVEVLRPALTRPGFDNLVVLFIGWIRATGTRSVTGALVAAGAAGRVHHEGFHRFFSRGTWSPDQLGRLVLEFVLRRIRVETPVRLVLDDTLAPKKGPHVFGIGCHLDPMRTTKRQKVFDFGHCWVVLALLLPMPFSRRAWALPLFFRLYRTQKWCERHRQPYRKKTELAREMLDLLVLLTGARRVELSADSAYCCGTVTRGLSQRIVLFGAMRPDAALTSVPPPRRAGQRGRPRIVGPRVAKPEALVADTRVPWQQCQAQLYGRMQLVHYKACHAQWYRACGTRLLSIVVVRVTTGNVPYRVFFSTDPTTSVVDLLETYAGRWAIEVCFRDLKQLFGFADSSARTQAAVERVAPFVGVSYTLLVLWAQLNPVALRLATPPRRPWYRHKEGLAFADLLRAADAAARARPVLDPAGRINNLRFTERRTVIPRQQALKFAG